MKRAIKGSYTKIELQLRVYVVPFLHSRDITFKLKSKGLRKSVFFCLRPNQIVNDMQFLYNERCHKEEKHVVILTTYCLHFGNTELLYCQGTACFRIRTNVAPLRNINKLRYISSFNNIFILFKTLKIIIIKFYQFRSLIVEHFFLDQNTPKRILETFAFLYVGLGRARGFVVDKAPKTVQYPGGMTVILSKKLSFKIK